MSQKQGSSKSKRTHKISSGLRRSSRKVRLSPLQLALMGKGSAGTYKPLPKDGAK